MATALLIIGAIIGLVGGVMLLIEAFKASLVWGLCYVFVPFAALVFVAMNWQVAKKPFLTNLAGFAIMFLGVMLAPEMTTTP